MIRIYHAKGTRSMRLIWLCEELALPYELAPVDFTPAGRAKPEWRRISPTGKVPAIHDGEFSMFESGAIVEYLLDTYGPGRLRPPPGTAEGRQFTYWLHFAEGSAMPPLLMKLVFDKVRTAPVPFFIKPVVKAIADKVTKSFIAPNLQRQFDFMEAELAKRPWFAGAKFSAADIQMSFPIEAAAARAGLEASRPRLMDWLERIHARPAYQRALEVGGPYSMAD